MQIAKEELESVARTIQSLVRDDAVHTNEKIIGNLIHLLEVTTSDIDGSMVSCREFKKRVRLLNLFNDDLNKTIKRHFTRLEKNIPEFSFNLGDLPYHIEEEREGEV